MHYRRYVATISNFQDHNAMVGRRKRGRDGGNQLVVVHAAYPLILFMKRVMIKKIKVYMHLFFDTSVYLNKNHYEKKRYFFKIIFYLFFKKIELIFDTITLWHS